ncbi:MAG: enoyl-CoA hydratase [Actinobacteria bacterium]|nr:enoyl-CoA hydratase [Actinomycetota bacterium]
MSDETTPDEVHIGTAMRQRRLDAVSYTVEDHVATVTMERPGKRNAMNTILIDDLDRAFADLDEDDEVRVVIVAGAGDHFCAGHDLKGILDPAAADHWREMRETAEGKLRHEEVMFYERSLSIRDFRKPTIAAVQGACMAAGVMLAAMCDLIVAADDAFFANPVLRMSGAGVELLVEPYELGFRKAKEFLFTGMTIDAQEAWRLGFVNRVVPRASLESDTHELAEEVAKVPPITAQMVKRSINDAQDLAGQRQAWRNHFMIHQFTSNTQTALGMLERRKQAGSMKEVFEQRDAGDEG